MRQDHGRPSALSGQRPRRARLRRGPGVQGIGLTLFALLLLIGGARYFYQNVAMSMVPAVDGTAESTALYNPIELGAEAVSGPTLEDIHAAEAAVGISGPTTISDLRFGPAEPFEHVSAQLGSGQTLVQALETSGVPRSEANQIVSVLQPHVDFRRLRPGDRFEGVMWLGNELIEGTFYHRTLGRYEITRTDEGLMAKDNPIRLTVVTDVVRGVVQTSLFESIYAAGERPALIMAFIDLFSWDFDFNVSTRAGDRFEMLVEKRFLKDEFYDYGPIIAGRYRSAGNAYEACWYQPEGDNRQAGYYHTDGSSVKGAFLRAPLRYSRISSRFTKNRFHPVLKVNRPHSGIDYAAPLGTPVYAVSNGYVLDARWMGGAGRAVRIKHPNGWITSYSHLSKIHVQKGQRVSQGQLVGRVGSSGYSTGPHLDFRVTINGRFVDPLKVDYPRGVPVPVAHRDAFQEQCSSHLARLDKGRLVVASE